jgi:hypothetical protein
MRLPDNPALAVGPIGFLKSLHSSLSLPASPLPTGRQAVPTEGGAGTERGILQHFRKKKRPQAKPGVSFFIQLNEFLV